MVAIVTDSIHSTFKQMKQQKMEEVSAEVIIKTQKTLGKYVTRPPLTDKLLRKPPFRFLHDIINATIRETGFLKGLFTDAELQSDNVKDRDGKIAFLSKLITAVKAISGVDLKVRASKVIAGLEATETNLLLQTIGICIEKKADSKEYVAQLKSKGKATSKEALVKKSSDKLSNKSKESIKVKKETPKIDKSKEKKIDSKSKGSKESISSNRAVKKKESPKNPVKDGNIKKNPAKDGNTKKISPKEGNIKKISPKEGNIKKSSPKEEAIVDVEAKNSPKIDDIQEETSINVNSKESTPKEVKEVEENVEIANKSIENYVKKKSPRDNKEESPKNVEKKVERLKSARPKQLEDLSSPKTSSDSPSEPPRAPSTAHSSAGPPAAPSTARSPLPLDKEQQQEKKVFEAALRPKSSLRPPSVRPVSARPGAPRLRPDSSSLGMKEVLPLGGKINVIVENFDANGGKEEEEDEEETVVIQNVSDEDPPDNTVFIEKSLDIPTDKGHLVEQILEQIQGPELEEQINLEHDNYKNRDATTKEIQQLRQSIQALTKTANPLGKLMSYLHEDVEAMHSELDTWMNMKRQYLTEIAKQKRMNADSNQPLKNQLQELVETIKKQRDEIAAIKFNILRNDEKIKELTFKQIENVQA